MLAIIQARSSSRRLPRKALMQINSTPLIGWTIKRLQQSQLVSKIVVATSDSTDDDDLANYVEKLNIGVYRGCLEDVVTRFLNVIELFRVDAFVRVCGDSPLIDPKLIDHAIALYTRQNCDLVTNVFPRTFPKGQSVEVIYSQAFIDAWRRNPLDLSREHITEIFYRNPSNFKIINFSNKDDLSAVQLSVDTLQDFKMILQIASFAGYRTASWEELVQILEICRGNTT